MDFVLSGFGPEGLGPEGLPFEFQEVLIRRVYCTSILCGVTAAWTVLGALCKGHGFKACFQGQGLGLSRPSRP